ncbi:MAG: Restriction system protein, partial [Polaromonas sp.]|nr:Restriction system protein [Polaromonas sp.]
MNQNLAVWGIHMGERVGARPIEQGYVAIGWSKLGDIQQYPDREGLKRALAERYADQKPGSWPVSAGVLFRFVREMKSGDIVVYPSKHDRMVNVGRFTGVFQHIEGDADDYPNRRLVEWLGHFPRNDFSQSALSEIGAYITVFLIKSHAAEFLAKIGLTADVVTAPEVKPPDETQDDDAVTVAVSKQAEITAGDFVIRQIMGKLSGYEFEELVAHLLECMGYTARVTARSGDGGVDVIAHRDKFGFEPPVLKVQCKRKTDQTGRPDVDQLLGTLG